MEVLLQLADDLDDLLGAGRYKLAVLGYRLLGLAGLVVAGCGGVAIGLGLGVMVA
jgi:hypothetical protein